MLSSVDENHSSLVIDLINDSEIPAPGQMESLQFATQRFSSSLRILRDGTKDRLDYSRPDFGGESIEMPQPFRRDLNLVCHYT